MVYKPLVADGVINKPLVNDSICHQRLVNSDPRKPPRACKRRSTYATKGNVHAVGSVRGSSCTCHWWHTWIVVCKPLVAHVDRRSQAFGGSWSPLQAFGGIRGSSCTSLLVAYVDRRVEAFGGIRGSPFTSLWCHMEWFGGIRGLSCITLLWHAWIVVHKHLVAD